MLQNQNDKERRKEVRVISHLPVSYKVHNSSPRNLFYNKVTANISSFGIRIIADKFIAPLTNVFLQVNVCSRIVDVFANVIWARKIAHSDNYHIGLEFKSMDFDKRVFLEKYLMANK